VFSFEAMARRPQRAVTADAAAWLGCAPRAACRVPGITVTLAHGRRGARGHRRRDAELSSGFRAGRCCARRGGRAADALAAGAWPLVPRCSGVFTRWAGRQAAVTPDTPPEARESSSAPWTVAAPGPGPGPRARRTPLGSPARPAWATDPAPEAGHETPVVERLLEHDLRAPTPHGRSTDVGSRDRRPIDFLADGVALIDYKTTALGPDAGVAASHLRGVRRQRSRDTGARLAGECGCLRRVGSSNLRARIANADGLPRSGAQARPRTITHRPREFPQHPPSQALQDVRVRRGAGRTCAMTTDITPLPDAPARAFA
jgi:hypothetical protein